MAPIDPVAAPGRCVVFTIVSRNYFHFALTLMDSVAQHLPSARRVIVVCDHSEGLDTGGRGLELLGIETLPLPDFDAMVHWYTILELNTAIKPFAFQHLFAAGAEQVIYFDPDIRLYASGAPLLQRLQQSEVVLTPHLTAPLQDEHHPSDLSILQSGTYNLGFLALRQSAATQALLQWWGGKLVRDCVVDIPRGLFTDQKWMDLVPGFVAATHIERSLGWNAAYWNLVQRPVRRDGSGWRVGGEPLFFFHFSGRDPRSDSVSKHQDRLRLSELGPDAQALFAEYESALQANGRERWSALPYAFAKLHDGTPLPEVARAVLRQALPMATQRPPLRCTAGAQFVRELLNAPVDDLAPTLSRLQLHLHSLRADLQAVFPDVRGAQRQAYLGWFAERAAAEAGVPAALSGVTPAAAGPSPAASSPTPATAPSSATAAVPPETRSATPAAAAATTLYRHVYRVAWNLRHVMRPLVPLKTRQRLRTALVRKAFAPVAPALTSMSPAAATPPSATATSPSATAPRWDVGVNLVGYVRAESGVGESARATLRALATTGLPHLLHDYRVGNVSRMSEVVAAAAADAPQHAVTLFHVNADQMPTARAHLPEAWFAVPYRIGFWAWELEQFPPQWQEAFDHVDEVWVPSTFCQSAVAAVATVPVLCMPHAIEIPARVEPQRERFGLREDSVVFLAMADMLSSAARKNPLGAVQAFCRAFAPDDARTQLVVKVSNPDRDAAAWQQLQAAAAAHPGVRLLPQYLDRSELNMLLDSVDAYVSLHRAEGFGLGLAEAMARGKVVLATAWSGNTDFVHAANAMPVDFRLTVLTQDEGPYARGQRWAEPDLDDAAAKMQQLVADATLRRRLGERARADCALHLAPDVIGRRMAARLRHVCAQRLP